VGDELLPRFPLLVGVVPTGEVERPADFVAVDRLWRGSPTLGFGLLETIDHAEQVVEQRQLARGQPVVIAVLAGVCL
jgi:hypothetical protein